MHGLFLRSVQRFVTDVFGNSNWIRIVDRAGLDFDEFEAMLVYDDGIAGDLLQAAEKVLDRPRADLLEDLGIYLIADPRANALPRLLRFGGATFEDFLHSLDDLPDWARLAVSNLELPKITLREHSPRHFNLTCRNGPEGIGYVMVGLLRALADDYGALAVVDYLAGGKRTETLSIKLLEESYTKGRSFQLARRAS